MASARSFIILCDSFQSKIRRLIKSTFYVYLGSDNFSSLFKESPCSPVLTFPSFMSFKSLGLLI